MRGRFGRDEVESAVAECMRLARSSTTPGPLEVALKLLGQTTEVLFLTWQP